MLHVINFTSEDYPDVVYSRVYEVEKGQDIFECMKKAAHMYLDTEEGKQFFESHSDEFTANDFVQWVPDEILERCGMKRIEADISDIDYSTVFAKAPEEDMD